MEAWTQYSHFFTALLVILDPFAAIPIFLALTHNYSDPERKRIANLTALTVVAVLITASLTGETLLLAMGTSLPSFRVSGGIVLMIMALAMLQSRLDKTLHDQQANSDRNAIAIVPMAIPLLAGPGAISTVILEMHRSSLSMHPWLVCLCIVLAGLVLWLMLRMAGAIGHTLGTTGFNIIHRLFGLVLIAIAVEIMANGLKELFPGLAG